MLPKKKRKKKRNNKAMVCCLVTLHPHHCLSDGRVSFWIKESATQSHSNSSKLNYIFHKKIKTESKGSSATPFLHPLIFGIKEVKMHIIMNLLQPRKILIKEWGRKESSRHVSTVGEKCVKLEAKREPLFRKCLLCKN